MPMSKINTLVSIIVPVYNGEKYLRECLASIVSQTYKKLEVIIIDDGSTDGSSDICDEYAKKAKRVSVIHKKNEGVSVARNVGIDRAQGEYLMFVDADDAISKTTIEQAVGYAQSASLDVVSFGYTTFRLTADRMPEYVDIKYRIIDKEIAIESLLYQKEIANAVFGKLFKLQTIGANRFKPRVKIAEDVDFNYRVLKNANRVGIISFPFYRYRLREGSAIRSGDKAQRIKAISIMEAILEDARTNGGNVKAAQNRLFMEIMFASQALPSMQGRQTLNAYWDSISRFRFNILVDPGSRAIARVYALVAYLGVNALIRLNDVKRVI